MRRTIATLLVVTSPLLLATPVGASDDRLPAQTTGAAVVPAAPASVPAVTPAVPTPIPAPAPATAAPALAAPALAGPAVPGPALRPAAPAPVRHVVRAVRPKAPAALTDLNDAAYDARLQAELCQARQIFCGLDRNGRYPAS